MHFHVLTLFPEMIRNTVSTSITGRAIEENKISVEAINIRDYAKNKHNKVDDYTYGGGAGMLMQAEPVYEAYRAVADKLPCDAKKRVIYVTPQGEPFHQELARELSYSDELIFLCGHYEGVDERVLEEIVTDYISIGDYVLTGGELASLVMIDAIARLVPGVLGNEVSSETESFHGDLLEYPQYSRPEVWHDKPVPQVLLSGNQKEIRAWRLEESVKRTRERRPDLYARYEMLEGCKADLMKQKINHIDMIETINRGNAILVARTETEILLQDKNSGNFYHTCLGQPVTADLLQYAEDVVVCHQKEAQTLAVATGLWEEDVTCTLACYTNREKLSITGLYRGDGEAREDGLRILPFRMEDEGFIAAHYHLVENPDYAKERIAAGEVFGAYYGDQVVGFIGRHDSGELGMLFVLEEYRRKHIAKALEVYMFNRDIELGYIPYGEIIEGNDGSIALQNSVGLNFSKGRTYWTVAKQKP